MHEFIYLHEYSISRLPTQSKDCFIQQFTFHNNLQLYLSIYLFICISISLSLLLYACLSIFCSYFPRSHLSSPLSCSCSLILSCLEEMYWSVEHKVYSSVWIEQESESLSNLIICVKCATHVYVVTTSSHLTCPHAFSPALLFIIYSVSLLEMAL